MAEPRMLPSELLRALQQMEASEAHSAELAEQGYTLTTEGYHEVRATVLREAAAVVRAHYQLEPLDGREGGPDAER